MCSKSVPDVNSLNEELCHAIYFGLWPTGSEIKCCAVTVLIISWGSSK